MKRHVFIATPTYDGKVHTEYCVSIAESIMHLTANGVDVNFVPNLSSTLLVLARNLLVETFIETTATHLMFIDSDLGFDPASILNLLNVDKDIVCGVYPSRKQPVFVYNPQKTDKGDFVRDEKHKHLLRADFIPSGFMLIKREAIVKMLEAYKYLKYEPNEQGIGDKGTLLFNTEVINGRFYSEDYVFCKRATDIGLEIWIDPRINFNHDGSIGALTVFPEIQNFLKN